MLHHYIISFFYLFSYNITPVREHLGYDTGQGLVDGRMMTRSTGIG